MAEQINTGTPQPVDIFFFSPGVSVDDFAYVTEYIDMNSMTVSSAYGGLDCYEILEDEIFFDMSPDFHPSEDIVVFDSDPDGPFNIYYADISDLANSREIQQLTDSPAGDLGYFEATWSPDGQKLLLLRKKAGIGEVQDAYIMSPIVGAIPTRITTDGVLNEYPRWVPYLGQ